MLFGLAGYLVSPIDLVPDFIPGLGQLDDIVLIAYVLDRLINRVPREVLLDHWEGDEDLLEIVRSVLDMSASLLPRWLSRGKR